MKKLIVYIVILIIAGLIGLQLFRNKKTIQTNAEISGIQVSKFPVLTYEVNQRNISQSFTVTGTFEAFRDLNFVSEVQGRVVKILVDKGDVVCQGQIIAQLDTVLLSSQLSLAEANYEKTITDLKRFELLAIGDAVSGQQLEEMKLANKTAKANFVLAQKNFTDASVKAPIAGNINERFIEIGSYLTPGMPIVQIIDMGKLKMVVNLSEQKVLQVKEKQQVSIAADLFPTNKMQGIVKSISVQSDNSKNYMVEIEFKNPDNQDIKLGMNGSVTFGNNNSTQILALPRKCIVGGMQSPQVFVVQNDTVVHLKNIQIGKEINDTLEILSGLSMGDKVVLSGQSSLREGTTVTVIND